MQRKPFIENVAGTIRYLAFEPWLDAGVRHGFIGSSLSFRTESLAGDASSLCRALGASRLMLLDQVHGTALLTVPLQSEATRPGIEPAAGLEILGIGDGMLVRPTTGTDFAAASRTIYAIRTADCLPILISSGDVFALVHAGWRGLSSGIVEAAISEIQRLSKSPSPPTVVIGPAAGGARYEVGAEVLAAFNGRAVHSPVKGSKALLDLSGTCAVAVDALGAKAYPCGICTMIDSRWHSYRREGEQAGRNLAFVVC